MRTKKILIVAGLFAGALSVTVWALGHFSHYKVTPSINRDAPVITQKSIVINAPVEKVWKIFTDVGHWSNWQKEITGPRLNGEFKPGTSFNWKSNGLTITSTLQTVEVNKMVGWSGPAFGAFAIHTWFFNGQNGQTVVRVEESMEGWLVKLLQNKFQSSLDASIEYWLNALKMAAEQT